MREELASLRRELTEAQERLDFAERVLTQQRRTSSCPSGGRCAMTVSLAGLTLHVADVDRSLAFYRRLPGALFVFNCRAGSPSFSWARAARTSRRPEAPVSRRALRGAGLDDAAGRAAGPGIEVDGRPSGSGAR